MHVLFAEGWFINYGNFMREHAQAISNYCKVTIIRANVIKSAHPFSFQIKHTTSEEFGATIHTLEVGTYIRRCGFDNFMLRRAYRRVIRKIEAQAPIDICHINVNSRTTRPLTDLSELKGKPFVVTEHSSFYHTRIYQLEKSRQKVVAQAATDWFNQPSIKAIMPVSQQLSTVLIEDFNVDKNKVTVLPNTINDHFFFEEKPQTEQINITLVAAWEGSKNPMLFLHALKTFPEDIIQRIHIEWIGGGSQLVQVKSFIEKELPELDVNFHGLVRDKAIVGKCMRAAHVFVHPTNYENLPAVIIESLCCGTPVISNRLNGIPELIDESNGLLSEAGDVEAFAKNILHTIKNPDIFDYRKIAQKAASTYSGKVVGRQIADIYEQILKA